MAASLSLVEAVLALRAPLRPAWLDGLRVNLPDGRDHDLQHLGHLTFTVVDAQIEPYRVVPATFVVDETLSLTTMVMAYPREAGSSSQVFSFVEAEPDILAAVTSGRDRHDRSPLPHESARCTVAP